jgi:CRP/FNR family transcriptional regulator, anaerobic regulatory protein
MTAYTFFNTLTKQLQEEIINKASKKSLKKGDILYYEGDVVPYIYLVETGIIRVQRHHDNGQSVMLYALQGASDRNIDIASAPSSTPAIGTAEAETDCTIYELKLELLDKLLQNSDAYRAFIFDMAMKRTQLMAEMIQMVRFTSLDDRIYSWLQEKAVKTLYITHEEIAYYHGTSREVVSRLLKKFEKRGILKLSRKVIELV